MMLPGEQTRAERQRRNGSVASGPGEPAQAQEGSRLVPGAAGVLGWKKHGAVAAAGDLVACGDVGCAALNSPRERPCRPDLGPPQLLSQGRAVLGVARADG